ncbi:DUF6270 domain-containing protein [Arthrobacter sp. zg-Y179]|uniref:DUF6270 domain-containing protein n=1 Tax=Arthrobacter sp. zg-Y179 TaxID=2894188 RepID=UPI001E3F887A|nr:DUF6270 domain-containing protein [Arthrobacter sp. zg-Y179]MCC9174283.1 DUF6270 domain-containing protein [Arthrobacter sp. zg-Y179]
MSSFWVWERVPLTSRMPRRIFVYGSNAASAMVTAYSSNVTRSGFVARQSLISAMNGPSNVELTVPADLTVSAANHVRRDAASSLTADLTRVDVDLLLWDLADERFGVSELSDGSFLTTSPQLARAAVSGTQVRRRVAFGSQEHLDLWQAAAGRFVAVLETLGLKSRTFVLDLPWAAADETGASVELSFGPDSRQMNTFVQPYYDHLRALGISVISEPRTRAASGHAAGRTPFNLLDSCYHSLAARLAAAAAPAEAESGSHAHWNLDERHGAPILHWTDIAQFNGDIPGRTEHVLAPRTKTGEEFPARFLLQNTGSDTLLVMSHGALPRGKYQVPRFEWLATLEGRPENLLFLADGALESHPDLELAWFTGNATDDLTARFSNIVSTVARQLGIHRILFMGGSGGGFASLALAASVPGSRALVFNPQTVIRKYWNKSVSGYQRTLFPELDSAAGLDTFGPRVSAVARVRTDKAESYQVIYVQNDDDAFHMENHLTPFAAALGMEARSSVSRNGNVQLLVDRFAEGHNMPYRKVLNRFVDLSLEDWGLPQRQWDRSRYDDLLGDVSTA